MTGHPEYYYEMMVADAQTQSLTEANQKQHQQQPL
jgi:hypothetical protein